MSVGRSLLLNEIVAASDFKFTKIVIKNLSNICFVLLEFWNIK